MAEVNWDSVLGKDLGEVEKPKPRPTGTYTFQVQEHRFDTSDKKGTPFVEFTCKTVDVGPDVDRAALALIKGAGDRKSRLTFYFTDGSEYRLKDFLGALGLSIGGGRTFRDAIPDTTSCIFKAAIRHAVMKNGSVIEEIDPDSIIKVQ